MKVVVVCSSSRTSRSSSAVRPEGPGAAPLRALRRLASSRLEGKEAGCNSCA